MKKTLSLLLLLTLVAADTALLQAGIKGLIRDRKPGRTVKLSQGEIAEGLKEALKRGITLAVRALGKRGGFYDNHALRIPFPPDAKSAERRLRQMGMGDKIDDFIRKMNNGAEDAAKEAVQIFIDAITSLSVRDAQEILSGGDTAATDYFRQTTTQALVRAFGPPIRRALEGTGAIDLWKNLARTYNRLPLSRNKLNPDIVAYTVEETLKRLFDKIADAERDIRRNPAARVTNILKKVFG